MPCRYPNTTQKKKKTPILRHKARPKAARESDGSGRAEAVSEAKQQGAGANSATREANKGRSPAVSDEAARPNHLKYFK
jgi:hypothetical protein